MTTYYFAVHCNEHANPKEDVEVIAFTSKAARDEFINGSSWSYEAVNSGEEIYAGPFFDWAEFKEELEDFNNPSRADWIYKPRATEPDITFYNSMNHVIALEDQTPLNLALVALCGVEPGRPIEDAPYQDMVTWVRSPEGQACWQDYQTAMDGFDADLVKAVEDCHDAADLIERRGHIYEKRNEAIAYYRNSYEAAHA